MIFLLFVDSWSDWVDDEQPEQEKSPNIIRSVCWKYDLKVVDRLHLEMQNVDEYKDLYKELH